jgi:glycosyltransferase involved in cell wall biosynthesis
MRGTVSGRQGPCSRNLILALFSSFLSILAFAYACEPDRGSEPGAGWDWAQMLAALDDTCVITRANNAEAIELSLSEVGNRNRLSFVYVDLPNWARFWKRGQRGARAYYLLWQLAALVTARRLRRERNFDVVWHLTLANLWMGSLAPLAGGRFVLGPVGGGVSPPLSLLPALGTRGLAYESVRAVARTVARYLNPLARLSWRRAELVLAQNPETKDWMPKRYRDKTLVFPHALVPRTSTPDRARNGDRPTLLFAGRLLPWKGVSLGLEALKLLPEWQLIICGSGPDETRLRRLAKRWGLLHRTEFRGWVRRSELARAMREEADVFLFPSLHDDAPLVVAEATAAGLPVVCLDRGGPPLLGGHPVAIRSPRETAEALATAVLEARPRGPGKVADRSEQLTRLREMLVHRGLLGGSVSTL